LVANNALELAQAHAVLVGHLRLLVNTVAFRERGPQRSIAHDHCIDHAVIVECELILAQHAHLSRAHDRALLRVQFPGEDFHKCGLAGAVGPGKTIAPSPDKGHGDLLKEDLRSIAHRHIADTDHLESVPVWWSAAE